MKYKIQLTKTFDKRRINEAEIYRRVIQLRKSGFNRNYILKTVGVSLDKIHRWTRTASKPITVKILEEFDKRFHRKLSAKDMEDIAYLVGYNLGDGNLSRNFCHTWFYGVYDDLFDIKRILLKFGVRPVIYKYKIDNGKMAVHDRIFSRFLFCFGAVPGDKTKSKVEVPKWILNSKIEPTKIRFLQGLFDSELNEISMIKRKNLAYQSLNFYTIKTLSSINGGVYFLNQLKEMLKSFGITTSKVSFDRKYVRSRDNATMQQIFFAIHSNYINLYNFITKIGFLYNFKRKKSAREALKNVERLSSLEKEKIKKYKMVLELHKKGISPYKIAKMLKLKDYTAKQWTYYKRKPRLFKSRINFSEG